MAKSDKDKDVSEKPLVVRRPLDAYLSDHPTVLSFQGVVLRLHHAMEAHTDAEWDALNKEHTSKQRFSD